MNGKHSTKGSWSYPLCAEFHRNAHHADMMVGSEEAPALQSLASISSPAVVVEQ